MLKVNYAGWNQSKELLREEALKAEHPRTRERLMALYEISDGKSATKVAKQTQRNPQTVMSWVHQYNQQGLAALKYKRSGGKNPACSVFTRSETSAQAVRFFSSTVREEIGNQIKETLSIAAIAPQERETKPRPRALFKKVGSMV